MLDSLTSYCQRINDSGHLGPPRTLARQKEDRYEQLLGGFWEEESALCAEVKALRSDLG